MRCWRWRCPASSPFSAKPCRPACCRNRRGLAVSEALAGQLVSVYALGSLLAALPAASLTQGWRRRRVLLLALLIFFVCNSLTAVSSDYRLTLLARFGSGVAGSLELAGVRRPGPLGTDVRWRGDAAADRLGGRRRGGRRPGPIDDRGGLEPGHRRRRSVGWHGVAALGQRDAALDPATADRLGRRAGLGQCRARFPRRPARLP
ncbi:MFS family transporter [Pseudomonas aeruginosa VRFPA02]|nr:MFS family transporter [Pseudomonas aeruginosa VRFPA02]